MLKLRGHVPFLIENREDEGFSWGPREYRLLRRTARVPDRIICVSDAVRRVVQEREGIGEHQLRIVWNGIHVPEPSTDSRSEIRAELGIPPEALVVGMVSNFNRPVKGARYLVEAAPHILSANTRARIVVFGTGKEETALRARAAALGVQDRLLFAGFKTDIARYYPALDMSVLTSLSEGLPISVLESMSHALPVVATAVGGTPEVVVDGVTGYLVPPKDTEAFAAKVVELLRNEELRRRMGEAGRRRVEVEFDIGRTAERYLEVYREVLGRET
jgi:glycosyltransferase involved in cell wall biosynthesis